VLLFGSSFAQIITTPNGNIQFNDMISNVRMLNTLGVVVQTTSQNSMRHSSALGGLCLACYIPVSLQYSHSSIKHIKRFCKHSCNINTNKNN
jgi:hypothetical protein